MMSVRKSERRRENSTVKITAITDVGSEPKDADHPSTDLDAQSKGGEEEVKSAVKPCFLNFLDHQTCEVKSS